MENPPVESSEQVSNFQCSRCDTACESLHKLNLHISLYHEDLKPYKCANCNVCYEREDEVLSHIVMCSKAVSLKCPRCLAAFDNEVDLNKHCALAHPYQCLSCDSAFVLKSNLNKHIKICHTATEFERPRVQCPLCPSDFASKSKLQRHHSGVHLKLRPFKCKECDVTFSQQATLNKHYRDHHHGSCSNASTSNRLDNSENSKTLKRSKRKTSNPSSMHKKSSSVFRRSSAARKKKNLKSTIDTEGMHSTDDSNLDDKLLDLPRNLRDFQTVKSSFIAKESKSKKFKSKNKLFKADNIKTKVVKPEELSDITGEPMLKSLFPGNLSPLSSTVLGGVSQNECLLCNKSFSQRSSLYRHLRHVHSYDTNSIQDTSSSEKNDTGEIVLTNSVNDSNSKIEFNSSDLLQSTPKKMIANPGVTEIIPTKECIEEYSGRQNAKNNFLNKSKLKKMNMNEESCHDYSYGAFDSERSPYPSKHIDELDINKSTPEDHKCVEIIKFDESIPVCPSDIRINDKTSSEIECGESMLISKLNHSPQSLGQNCQSERILNNQTDQLAEPHCENNMLVVPIKAEMLPIETLNNPALVVESETLLGETQFNELEKRIGSAETSERILLTTSNTHNEQIVEQNHLWKSVEQITGQVKIIEETIPVAELLTNVSESKDIKCTAPMSHLENIDFISSPLQENNNNFSISSDSSVLENENTTNLKKIKCPRMEATEDVFHIKSDEEDETDLKQQINQIYLSLEESSSATPKNSIQQRKADEINSAEKQLTGSIESNQILEKPDNNFSTSLQINSEASLGSSDHLELENSKVSLSSSGHVELENSKVSLSSSCHVELENSKVSLSSCVSLEPVINADMPVPEMRTTTNRRSSKRLLSLNSLEVKKTLDKKLRSSRSLSVDAENDFSVKANISLPLERTEEEEQFLYLKNKEQLKANEKLVVDSNTEKLSPPKLRGRPSKRKYSESSFEAPPKKRAKPDDFVEGTFRCMECHAMFYKKKDYEGHMDNAHRETRPYRCTKCSACFKNDKALEIHGAAVHDKLKPHICPKCGTGFGQRASLYRHMKEVIHDLIYCSDCNACFNVKKDLAEHINNEHSTLKPFRCNQCDKSFVSKHQLAIHTATVHEKRRPYKCEQCGAAFGQRGSLHRHLKTVDHKILPFSCSFCSGKFRRKEDLKNHVSAEHKKADAEHKKSNAFKCIICDAAFKLEKMLDAHMKVLHSSVTSTEDSSNKLTCSDCNELFSDETQLNFHIRSVHDVSIASDLQCINCQKLFSKKRLLKRHLESASLNAASLECVYCNVQFCQKSQLTAHVKETHSEPEVSGACVNDITIKDEQIEDLNNSQQACSANSLQNLDVAIIMKQKLENIVDSIKVKHDRKDKSVDNLDYVNKVHGSVMDDVPQDLVLHAVNYSSSEKNTKILEADNFHISKETLSAHLNDPSCGDQIQESFMEVSKSNDHLLETESEVENCGNEVRNNSYHDPKLKEACPSIKDLSVCNENHISSVGIPREKYNPIITKQEHITAEKGSYLKEHQGNEHIIYDEATASHESTKFVPVREYYEGHSDSYVRTSEYSLPISQHSSQQLCYVTNEHLDSNGLPSGYEETTSYVEARPHLDSSQKSVNASCKGYEHVSYLSTQTNNSIHYVQAKPRPTIVTYESSKQISSLQSDTFEGGRRNYDAIEYTSTSSPMNDSIKYVRAEYTAKPVSLNQNESDKFLRTECTASAISTVGNVSAPMDATCKVYTNSTFVSMPNQLHPSVKYLDRVNISEHHRNSIQIEEQHPATIEYTDSIHKTVENTCKAYIPAEYISTDALSEQPMKFTESSQKLSGSTCKSYLHSGSGYLSNNSVIQPIKYIPVDAVQSPIDASLKNYTTDCIQSRHMEQENLSDTAKYVPTIQKAAEAKNYISMPVTYEDGSNNGGISQSIKYMHPPMGDSVKIYARSEHPRANLQHGAASPKNYGSPEYSDVSHSMPVNETIKYIEGISKPVDATQKNVSYERSEYYVPVTIGDAQYFVRQADTTMQNYNESNSYAVPINVEEVNSAKANSLETLYAHYDAKDLSNQQYAIFIDENREFAGKQSEALSKVADIPGKGADDTHPTSHYALTLHLMEALEKHVGASTKGMQLKAYNENGESYSIEEDHFPTTSQDKQMSVDSKQFVIDELNRKIPTMDPNANKSVERGTIVRTKYGNIVALKAECGLDEEKRVSDSQVLDCSTDNVVIIKDSLDSDHTLPSTQIFKLGVKYSDEAHLISGTMNMKDESMIQDAYGTQYYIHHTFLCTSCQAMFETQESLEHHLSTHHQNEMP